VREVFSRFASRVSEVAGSSWAFLAALGVIIVWGVSGPIFGFSDTWQLVINTGTTIVTFLMVFLIQNTQSRDTKAIQLKLDELLRAVEGARQGEFMDLERRDEREVERVHQQLEEECQPGESAEEHARHSGRRGRRNGRAPARARSSRNR
jgi:low affinity Fe/Cu permease